MLISKNKFEYFEDLRFAFTSRPILSANINDIRAEVFKSKLLQDFIQNEIKEVVSKDAPKNALTYTQIRDLASKYLGDIEAQINHNTFRTSLYMFVKIWDRVYEQIVINEG